MQSRHSGQRKQNSQLVSKGSIDKHYENLFPSTQMPARLQKKPDVLQFRWMQPLPFLGSVQLHNFILFLAEGIFWPKPFNIKVCNVHILKFLNIKEQEWWTSSRSHLSRFTSLLRFPQDQSNHSSISRSTHLAPLLLGLSNEQLVPFSDTESLFSFSSWDSEQSKYTA